jgi:hypothetical protein
MVAYANTIPIAILTDLRACSAGSMHEMQFWLTISSVAVIGTVKFTETRHRDRVRNQPFVLSDC